MHFVPDRFELEGGEELEDTAKLTVAAGTLAITAGTATSGTYYTSR